MRLRKIINIKRSLVSKLAGAFRRKIDFEILKLSFPPPIKAFEGRLQRESKDGSRRGFVPARAGIKDSPTPRLPPSPRLRRTSRRTGFGNDKIAANLDSNVKRSLQNTVFSRLVIIFFLGVFFAVFQTYSAAKESHGKNLPVEASAAIDKASIQIGDKFTYVITVKAQNNIEVEFPQILPENLAGFAIKDFGSSQKGLFGKRVFKQWLLMDTYVSGEHTIPAPVVKYRAKGSADWREESVNEVKIEVKSVLDAASTRTDIRDIRGPKSFAEKIWFYALTALAAFLIIAAVSALILLKKRKEEFEAPPAPAHVIAYKALAALEKKDYIRRGQTKAYYIELSDIVRYYLENRFNIRAPEMTTEEFLVKVKEDSALFLEHKGLLRDFLSNCDLVKFARYQPVEQEAALNFASAKRLIDQTKEEAAA